MAVRSAAISSSTSTLLLSASSTSSFLSLTSPSPPPTTPSPAAAAAASARASLAIIRSGSFSTITSIRETNASKMFPCTSRPHFQIARSSRHFSNRLGAASLKSVASLRFSTARLISRCASARTAGLTMGPDSSGSAATAWSIRAAAARQERMWLGQTVQGHLPNPSTIVPSSDPGNSRSATVISGATAVPRATARVDPAALAGRRGSRGPMRRSSSTSSSSSATSSSSSSSSDGVVTRAHSSSASSSPSSPSSSPSSPSSASASSPSSSSSTSRTPESSSASATTSAAALRALFPRCASSAPLLPSLDPSLPSDGLHPRSSSRMSSAPSKSDPDFASDERSAADCLSMANYKAFRT
ncbi:unnamed protein product, partial [Closterium sp. NIES-53]